MSSRAGITVPLSAGDVNPGVVSDGWRTSAQCRWFLLGCVVANFLVRHTVGATPNEIISVFPRFFLALRTADCAEIRSLPTTEGEKAAEGSRMCFYDGLGYGVLRFRVGII